MQVEYPAMPTISGLGGVPARPERAEDFPWPFPQDGERRGRAQVRIAIDLLKGAFKTDTIIIDASEFY
jgi:hypothetical protein